MEKACLFWRNAGGFDGFLVLARRAELLPCCFSQGGFIAWRWLLDVGSAAKGD